MPLIRLDILVFQKGLATSREQAQTLIRAGKIWSGTERLEKPGTKVKPDLALRVELPPPFVSRAGEKLCSALEHFGLTPQAKYCVDIGASTGGFTDCLVQKGAQHVVALDVGRGQFDYGLKQHEKVTSIESYNVRHLTAADFFKLSQKPASLFEWLVMDVSFISVQKLIPNLFETFNNLETWIILFKPQFELGREHVTGGLVRDKTETFRGIDQLVLWMETKFGLYLQHKPFESPIVGKKLGNQEILLYFSKKETPI